MKKKIIVALIMLLAVAGAFSLRLAGVIGNYFFDMLICCLSIFCALETTKLVSAKGVSASPISAGIYPSLAYAGHMLCFVFSLEVYWYVIIQICILAFCFLLTFVVYSCLNTEEIQEERKTFNLSKVKFGLFVGLKSLFCFVYPCLFMLCFMLLNRIDSFPITGLNRFNGTLSWVALISAVVIPIVTDTTAMFCGKLFKGPKLCKKISPNKTISGAISAIIVSSGVMCGLFFVFNSFSDIARGFFNFDMSFWQFILLGFFGSIVCQAGDLFESFLKRRANVKDSGNILPGHGGVLDRLDSHLFSAPFVLLFFVLLMII